jgi:hypothetical protein
LGGFVSFCTVTCEAPPSTLKPCPGETLCYGVDPSICVPLCIPGDNDCPLGLSCYPYSPRQDLGYCWYACGSPDAGGYTCDDQSACNAPGYCGCVEDEGCSWRPGSRCDVTSGTCYYPCSSSSECSDAGLGCCAQAGTLTFCDLGVSNLDAGA